MNDTEKTKDDAKDNAAPTPNQSAPTRDIGEYQALVTNLTELRKTQLEMSGKYTAENPLVKMNQVHIDDLVVKFISTHGTIATDTRFVLAASKIANNLERIADEATTIARRARELNCEPPLRAS